MRIYMFVALGIVISVVLPILRSLLPKPPSFTAVGPTVRSYLVLGLFSLLAAVLIVAGAGETLVDWRAALLAGYAWDSTLQKLALK